MEEDIRYLYEQQIFEETEDDTFDEIGDLSVPNYRITPEGYEYKTTALFDESAFVESVAPEMGFLGEGGLDDEEGAVRQRRTVVIGEDTRSVVPVSDVTRYPFRTIGQVSHRRLVVAIDATHHSRILKKTVGLRMGRGRLHIDDDIKNVCVDSCALCLEY